jgi:hypothetical protein
MAFSRRRLVRGRLGLKLVTLAYVLALAMLPLGHHDAVCHAKSTTHCSSCNLTTSGESGAQPGLPAVVLADAGEAETAVLSRAMSCTPVPSPGRSPPLSAVSTF